MKKNIFLLIVFALILNACEKDDICLADTTTPKLILRFYDASNPNTLKSVQNLSVWAEGKDTLTTYKSTSADSIAIPLNVNTNQTVYHFKQNAVDGNLANNQYNTITINYNTEEIYISRSCGFITNFNTVNFSSNNGWIQSFTPISLTTIDNENEAHVKIFH